MGGKFEIIIVVIGLAWAIASSVMQKKAKAAKAARLKAIALEGGIQPAAPAAPTPTESIFDRLINNLREQPKIARSTRATGGTVKVRPTAPQMEMGLDDEPAAVHMIDQVGLDQKNERADKAASSAFSYADVIEATLKDPRRIREAILLQEILGPPVALRS